MAATSDPRAPMSDGQYARTRGRIVADRPRHEPRPGLAMVVISSVLAPILLVLAAAAGSGVGWCGDRTGSSEVARCEAQARGNVVALVVVLIGVAVLFVIGVVRMLRNPRQR